jgi:hypothetical protein
LEARGKLQRTSGVIRVLVREHDPHECARIQAFRAEHRLQAARRNTGIDK